MDRKDLLLLEKDVRLEQKLEKKIEQVKVDEPKPMQEPKTENIVVKTPNYDLLPELPPEKKTRVLKLTKKVEEQKKKTRSSVLKKCVFGSLLALVVGLGVFTAVDLADTMSAYNAAQNEYSINVATLIKNLYSADGHNKAAELVETHPKDIQRPDAVKKESNWFDRFCDFLSGFFGG